MPSQSQPLEALRALRPLGAAPRVTVSPAATVPPHLPVPHHQVAPHDKESFARLKGRGWRPFLKRFSES